MSVRPEDFSVIAATRAALGIPDNVEATPAQTLELLRIVPGDVAERMVATWRDAARQGRDCWMRNHDRQIDYWRDRALAAEVEITP